MTDWTRRAAIVGGMACGLPLRAAPDAAADLRRTLDTLPTNDPSMAAAGLDRYDAARLPLAARLDLLTVRAGLAVDRALAVARDPLDRFALQVARRIGPTTLPVLRARLTREHDRLSRMADRLLGGQGFVTGNVGTRFSALFADPRWHYSNDEQGRDQAVADMNRWLGTRRAAVPDAFAAVPDWCLEVAAKRLPRVDELAGKGGYRVLPEPGRSGAYFVDLKDIARRPRWSLPSVVAHELLPGHTIQLPIEATAKPHPLRLTYASAFAEGWATWAEQLADRQGAFVEPLDRLGHLHWLLFRVGRGLADIAIHCDGWPVDRAEAALREWQGEPAYFAPFATDLARVVADPGARAAEALAWLAIADRAPRGSTALKVFHARTLAGGRKRSDQL